jgi:DnaJ-class molecular chaperone
MKYVVPNHPSHPDGLTIEIPKGVQNNEVILVLNEGMPKRNTKFFGNFHLKVEVVIDEKEKKVLADNEEVIRKLFT